MPTLLLEIGCEELPASACREAEAQLPALGEREVGAPPAKVFVGPRRLALLFEDVAEQTPDEWIKGPPEALAEKAAAGFAKKHGVGPEDLVVRDGFLGVERPGRPLGEVLPQRVDAIVRGLSFSKSMRWDDSGIRFARPVRWLLAKLEGETLVGESSFGHRFTRGAVEVPDASAYAETLRAAGVEPDAEERRLRIVEGLDGIGGWSDPAGVLEEVIYLVESVLVLEGEFDERFLQLPERVIVTAMQSHQRYFPLGGNRFAFVANGGDPGLVRAGNENVLEGRLDDASFTFERDVRRGIDELAEGLSAITFFKGAGSFADKTERLRKLVAELGGGEATLEAARLAKADQASELVREFPDLEGYIGAEYARLAGYPEAVSAAIEEHYLPDSAGGPLPQTEAGKVLAAADKLDTLTTSFGLGHKPTGSRDPYGLRRAAIGLNRLAVEGGLTIPRALLDDEVREFVEERLEGLLDVPVEYVRAAQASAAADLGGVARLAESLHAERDSPEFDGVYTAYDRAHRLAGKSADEAAPQIDSGLLREEAERALAEGLAKVAIDGDTRQALESGATLAPLMERFFEEVLVMDEDEAVRANRLRLLLDVRDTLGRLGDFSQIPR
jgi:tetrameric-type glycyl-tRNA synthetase beta subunit